MFLSLLLSDVNQNDLIYQTPTRGDNPPWKGRCNTPGPGQVPDNARLQPAGRNQRAGDGGKLAKAAKQILAVLTRGSRFTVAIAKMTDNSICIAYNLDDTPWEGFPFAYESNSEPPKLSEVIKILMNCQLITNQFDVVIVLSNQIERNTKNHMKRHAEMQITRYEEYIIYLHIIGFKIIGFNHYHGHNMAHCIVQMSVLERLKIRFVSTTIIKTHCLICTLFLYWFSFKTHFKT